MIRTIPAATEHISIRSYSCMVIKPTDCDRLFICALEISIRYRPRNGVSSLLTCKKRWHVWRMTAFHWLKQLLPLVGLTTRGLT